jgi:hypothetical protein
MNDEQLRVYRHYRGQLLSMLREYRLGYHANGKAARKGLVQLRRLRANSERADVLPA